MVFFVGLPMVVKFGVTGACCGILLTQLAKTLVTVIITKKVIRSGSSMLASGESMSKVSTYVPQ